MGMRFTAPALALAIAAFTTSAEAAILDVGFDDGTGTVVGTVSLVDIVTGLPAGGSTALPGGVAPGAGDVTLVFQLTVDVGDVTEFGVGITDGITPLGSTGAGWIPNDPGLVDITSISGTSDTRIFSYDEGGVGAVLAGQSSDLFFVSYSSLALDGSLDINFMITDGVPTFSVSVPLVPAPGALLLLGTGLVGLAGRRRRN